MTAARRLIAPTSPVVSVDEAYDLAAPFYDTWTWQQLWREAELPLVRSILGEQFGNAVLDKRLPDGLDLLDVGCGTGWYLEQLRLYCDTIAGVDVSAGMLSLARRRVPQGVFLQSSANRLPFASGCFTTVLCTRVLSHLADPRIALGEMARVLARGGVLILSNVDASHPYTLTRLPTSDGHVLTDTYKHARVDLATELAGAGLTHDRSLLIEEGGETVSIATLSDPVPHAIAGWISAWRSTALG